MERKKPTTTDAVSPFRDNVVPKEKKRSMSASRGGALTPTVTRFSIFLFVARAKARDLHFAFPLLSSPPPRAFPVTARVYALLSVCPSI